MTLAVSNTLTGETEAFEPIEPGRVSLYFCGLTVNDDAHLGHARSWVHTDVIRRWFEHVGFDVTYVENFTDVNEKIVARIDTRLQSESDVARYYIERILRDMRSLNIHRADVYPRVSEHIPEIVALIERLLESGYAYEAIGSVYFDVTTFPDYGRLSHQSLDDMEVQAADGPLEEKRHPQDFALWKAGPPSPEEIAPHRPDDAPVTPAEAIEGAATYPAPWGDGRPGWHIECSAMSTAHLGQPFDIHIAGHDIRFPHNENEIAQSEAAAGEQFSRYWLHTGMLRIGGEKMSSSLENFLRVEDAVDRYGPNVLRTLYLSSVYRADQRFDDDAIAEAAERWERLERARERAVASIDSADARTKIVDDNLRSSTAEGITEITAAMNDDFNTREAMSALLDLAGAVNRHVDGGDEYDYAGLLDALDVFDRFGGDVFGFAFEVEHSTRVDEDLIELILEVREQERAAGNFERADALRTALEERGVEVQDTDDGPRFRIEH